MKYFRLQVFCRKDSFNTLECDLCISGMLNRVYRHTCGVYQMLFNNYYLLNLYVGFRSVRLFLLRLLDAAAFIALRMYRSTCYFQF